MTKGPGNRPLFRADVRKKGDSEDDEDAEEVEEADDAEGFLPP